MNEKFIVEQKDGYTVQRKLNVLTGKIVHYIFQCSKDQSGFYFVNSKDYDGSLKISHSDRVKKIFKVGRNIEPGIITIHDLKLIRPPIYDKKDGFTQLDFRILGM